MIEKIAIRGMVAHDMCKLDYTDPPLSIEHDLGMLPPDKFAATYKSRSIDSTYWQFGGPRI